MADSRSTFEVAVAAFTAALGDRLAPGLTTFPDLFDDAGTIDVPFDGDGTAAPITGRAAMEAMAASLEGFLRFDRAEFTAVRDTTDPDVVVCEYETVLRRADRDGPLRRRYISVIRLRNGRILHLREYGGPFMSVS